MSHFVDPIFINAKNTSEGGFADACDPDPADPADPADPDELCCGLEPFNKDFNKQWCCGGFTVDELFPFSECPTHHCQQTSVSLRPDGKAANCPPHRIAYFCCGGN